jgi:hypothetical protein
MRLQEKKRAVNARVLIVTGASLFRSRFDSHSRSKEIDPNIG